MFKYIAYILYGAIVGFLIGFATPIAMHLAMYWLITQKEGDANGMGTIFAILMIITTPIGLLVGILAGEYRGRTGKWEGLFDWERLFDPTLYPNEVELEDLQSHFLVLDRQLTELPEDEAAKARASYTRFLFAYYQKIKPNYGLFLICLLMSVLIPILIIFLLKLSWDHWQTCKRVKEHIEYVNQKWSSFEPIVV